MYVFLITYLSNTYHLGYSCRNSEEFPTRTNKYGDPMERNTRVT